jgi:hypothetical protein
MKFRECKGVQSVFLLTPLKRQKSLEKHDRRGWLSQAMVGISTAV